MARSPKSLGEAWTRVLLVGSAIPLGACTDRVLEAQLAPGGGGLDTDAFDDGGVDPFGGDASDTEADPTAGVPEPLPEPPQLVDVRFLDADSLQLTYTEPMAAPTRADPTAFRLSVALAYDYDDGAVGTIYVDPTYYNGEAYCSMYCGPSGCYDYCYGSPGPSVAAVGLALDATDPRRLVLELANPVSPSVCRTLESFANFSPSHGLFLHYTDDRNGVTDAEGEPALALAEHWALSPGVLYASRAGSFPWLDPLLPIPCPF